MNSDLKLALDEQLVSGMLSPEEYLKSIRESLNEEANSDRDAAQTRPGQQHQQSKYRLRPWMWGVAVPVLLLIRFDQMPRTPISYDPSQYISSSQSSGDVSPPAPNREKLRDYQEQTSQGDIFSMPSQPASGPNINPQQNGGQPMSQEDAFALGLIMSPLLQAQQAYAQQQELTRKQQMMQQQMLSQQAEAQRQQRSVEFAQRFQSLGMPDYARPKPTQQQVPYTWYQQQPQPPAQSQRPSLVEPQSRTYNFTCGKCGLNQVFNSHNGGSTRCPNCGSMMFSRR